MSRIPPFHLAIPVHNLSVAMNFYGRVMGCIEGRKCKKNKWIDYNFYGHQLVLHVAHENYKPIDHFNPVDGDEVPLPHFGLCLSIQDWKDMRDKLVAVQTKFIIQPRLRFAGQEGEQYTMFFKDPTGNNLEMKAMIKPENLFKHYEVQ